MTLLAIVVGYIKLSAVCATIMAVIAAYDTRRYPICSACNENTYTRRPKLFSPLATCQLHGRIAA